MNIIQIDNIKQKEIIENNLFLFRQHDKNFVERLNTALDFALTKLKEKK